MDLEERQHVRGDRNVPLTGLRLGIAVELEGRLQQLDPVRVNTVRTALQRLDLLQDEGVILAMPEITVAQ